MPTPPDPTERRYSEKELSLILQRATERQALAPRGGSDGLSLSEIQEIAAEVGLSPEEVAMAAAQVRAEGAGRATGAAFEFTLPAELDERQVGELFEAARDRTHARGTVRREPNGSTWTSTEGIGVTRVSVTSRGGRSRLAVSQRSTGSVLGAVGGGALTGVVVAPVAGILFASLVGAGFLALVLGVVAGILGGIGTGWALLRRTAGKWRERTNALGSELTRVAMHLVTRGDSLEGSRDAPRLPGETGS
ncbi:MAG TPA: hypothetical protein VGE02_06745 [Gemmatimonadales bacterium]